MKFVGIDLHTTSLTATFLTTHLQNATLKKISYALSSEGLEGLLKELTEEMYVAVEATANAFWFYELIAPAVKAFYVLNTHKVHFDGNKTDKIDSEKLARCLAYYICMGEKHKIPAVYIPKKEVQELRSLFTSYRLSKKCATQLKNKLQGLLKERGISLKRGSLNTKKGRSSYLQIPLSSIVVVQMQSLMRQLAVLESECKVLKAEIIKLGYSLFPAEVELLLSIKGISAFVAIALMADVVTVERFKTAKKFCSYLRTAPSIKESNQTTYLGRVNKRSRILTCSLMTQAITHLQEANPHFKGFYQRVKTGKSSGKARLALVRKTLVAAYYILKKKELFYNYDKTFYESKKEKLKKELQRISTKSEKKIA